MVESVLFELKGKSGNAIVTFSTELSASLAIFAEEVEFFNKKIKIE